MRVYMEIDGTNPRNGRADTAYSEVLIDDDMIHTAADPIAFVADALRTQIETLLATPGVARSDLSSRDTNNV